MVRRFNPQHDSTCAVQASAYYMRIKYVQCAASNEKSATVIMIEPVQFFKCLSDETRLHSSLLIRTEGELCVCELTEALDDSQPKISRHLAQLRNCGILVDIRRGQWVFYSINAELPSWALGILDIACEAHSDALSSFKKNLTTMQNRPVCG